MTYINAIILGAVQGLAEFLPVSSSGHLVVLQYLMDLGETPLLFDVLLHIATLVVVFIVFWDRILKVLKALVRYASGKREDEDRENMRLFLIILLATVFTGALGLFLEKLDLEGNVKLVFLLFIVTGFILILSRKLEGSKDYGSLGVKQGLITGLAQGIGVLPGISRSGITISAALASGMTREQAGEFSFLISIPAILGALILQLKDADSLFGSVSLGVVAAGMISAFIVGLVSLRILLRLIKKGNLYYFSFYLIPLGIAGLIFY